MGGEIQRAEQHRDGAVAHVQSARVGAEGRYDEAAAIGGEAAPAERLVKQRATRLRMQMAGDPAVGGNGRRFVPEGEGAERQHFGEAATDARNLIGIVVAGDPQPVAATLSAPSAAVGSGHAATPPPS